MRTRVSHHGDRSASHALFLPQESITRIAYRKIACLECCLIAEINQRNGREWETRISVWFAGKKKCQKTETAFQFACSLRAFVCVCLCGRINKGLLWKNDSVFSKWCPSPLSTNQLAFWFRIETERRKRCNGGTVQWIRWISESGLSPLFPLCMTFCVSCSCPRPAWLNIGCALCSASAGQWLCLKHTEKSYGRSKSCVSACAGDCALL